MSMDVEADAVAERGFHAVLLKIDSDLHQSDLQALKFLVKGNLHKNKLTKMSTGHELFAALETSKLIHASNRWLLVEMFDKIGRLDLIDYVDDEITEDLKSTHLPTGEISDYRLMLFDTAQDLTEEDTKKLTFLLHSLPKAKLGKVSSGLDLITLMEEAKIIAPDHVDKLRQYLETLTRLDLVKKIDQYTERRHQTICAIAASASQECNTKGDVRMTPAPVAHSGPPPRHTADNGVPESIRLQISEDLCQHKRVDNLATFWSHLGYQEDCIKRLQSGLQGLTHGERIQKMIECAPSLQSVDYSQALMRLVNALRFAQMFQLSEQLVQKLKAYLPREMAAEVLQRPGDENRNHYVTTGEATELAQPTTDQSLSSINLDSKQSRIPTYKMNANPRGICVIINNFEFWPGREGLPDLKNRTGTHIDAAKLADTFTRLHFEIVHYNDLSSEAMTQVLRTIGQEMVKAEHDCFVCCILSHGDTAGKVYGSDSMVVEVNQLKAPFRPDCCPNLARKPKLFFLQACQGKEMQEGVQVQSDSDLKTDRPTVMVANEADFLVGYATTPGYVSYRSKSKGSWYINKLTKMLDTLAHTEDLLSILTKVNNEVGMEVAPQGGKQSPAPQFTLTKRLIFHKLESDCIA
ncbi:caspase-8-like [Haliotis asinina]|uniref:caspase-8-like n=1 Tax=Haliotis asinina TaxID=109174 RepID=UPI003531AFDA